MQKEKNEIVEINNDLNPHLWVEKYADYLYGFAITRLNNEDLVKDLVQETFLAALARIGTFEGKSSERTWLTAILKNKIVDIYRKKASGRHRIDISPQSVSGDDDFFDSNDGHWKVQHQPVAFGIEAFDPLLNNELAAILRQCMKKLPSLWLSIFTMKHIDDLKTEIICSELKVTPANFWVIMHRAKLNLRACLQKNWIERYRYESIKKNRLQLPEGNLSDRKKTPRKYNAAGKDRIEDTSYWMFSLQAI